MKRKRVERDEKRLALELAARLDAGLLEPAAGDGAEMKALLPLYARLQDTVEEPDPGLYRWLRRSLRREGAGRGPVGLRALWTRLLAWPHWRPVALVGAVLILLIVLVSPLLSPRRSESAPIDAEEYYAALQRERSAVAAREYDADRYDTYAVVVAGETLDDLAQEYSLSTESEWAMNAANAVDADGVFAYMVVDGRLEAASGESSGGPTAGYAHVFEDQQFGADYDESDRMVARQAGLAFVVQDAQAGLARLEEIAADQGGGVYDSETGRTQQGSLYTTVSIRVPAEDFGLALAQVRALDGELIAERITSQDVTASYVDLGARLRNLELAEQELQELQESAQENGEKASGILKIHGELTGVRQQIEQIKGQMILIESSVAMAQIRVTLIPEEIAPEPPAPPGFDPGRVLGEAWAEVVRVLEDIATGLLWALAFAPIVLPPVGLAALAVWLVARRARRRGGAAAEEENAEE